MLILSTKSAFADATNRILVVTSMLHTIIILLSVACPLSAVPAGEQLTTETVDIKTAFLQACHSTHVNDNATTYS